MLAVDPKLLEKSPLSPGQKDILRRIYVLNEPVGKVAKDLNKSPGTISSRRKRALKRYNEFATTVKGIVADEVEKFRARLDQHEAQLVDIFGVLEDDAKYLSGLRFVTDEAGLFRTKNCVHNANGKCNKWPSIIVGPKTCGICVDFLERDVTDAIDVHD